MSTPPPLSDDDNILVQSVWDALARRNAPIPLAVLAWIERIALQDALVDGARRRLRMWVMLVDSCAVDITRATQLAAQACSILERHGYET